MSLYVSVDEFKAFTKYAYLDVGFASDDDFEVWLEGAITQVEAFVDQYLLLPRGFFKTGGVEVTEICKVRNNEVHLGFTPVLAVSEVEYRTDGSWQQLANEAYAVLSADDGILYCASPSEQVRVTYQAGYEETPDDVKLAVILLTDKLVAQRALTGDVRIGDVSLQLRDDKLALRIAKKILGKRRTVQVMLG